MSVFERTLNAVAPAEVVLEINKRAADEVVARELAAQVRRDEAIFHAACKEFVEPALEQFDTDARKNGYWARHVAPICHLKFIPISQSLEYLSKDRGALVLLTSCLFLLDIELVARTSSMPALVRCVWRRSGAPEARRTTLGDVPNEDGSLSSGGFFSDVFMRYEVCSSEERRHALPARSDIPLSEAAKDWAKFVDDALAEFMAHCLQLAQTESLYLQRAPGSQPKVKSSANRGLLGFLFGRD